VNVQNPGGTGPAQLPRGGAPISGWWFQTAPPNLDSAGVNFAATICQIIIHSDTEFISGPARSEPHDRIKTGQGLGNTAYVGNRPTRLPGSGSIADRLAAKPADLLRCGERPAQQRPAGASWSGGGRAPLLRVSSSPSRAASGSGLRSTTENLPDLVHAQLREDGGLVRPQDVGRVGAGRRTYDANATISRAPLRRLAGPTS